jgi:hypothetical protein
MDFFKLFAKQHILCEGDFTLLTLLFLPEAAINDDDTIWPWPLQLIIDVARSAMETVEGLTTKDHVVCTLEGDQLKGYGLFAEIILIAEGNLEGDEP